ncbi:MAG: PEP-CTERM sorting domain-containing protein [Planctomycetota bacterium]
MPEPGTMLLVGSGLAGAAMARRRRKEEAVAQGDQPTS